MLKDVSPERRAQILAEFPAIEYSRPMDPALSTVGNAVRRAESIVRQVWSDADRSLATRLFDPGFCPEAAVRVDQAAWDLRRRETKAARKRALGVRGALSYDTFDTDHDPDDVAEQGVARVWFVGSSTVYVARARWRNAPNRRQDSSEFLAPFIDLLRTDHERPTLELRRLGEEPRCDINLASGCGGTVKCLPAHRGTLLLVVHMCRPCRQRAELIAACNEKLQRRMADLEVAEDWTPPADT